MTAKKPGRPTTYSKDAADKLIAALETDSLNRVCQRDGFPSRSTVYEWMEANPDFRTRCARAREAYADGLVDEIQDIEDKTASMVIPPDVARVVISSKQWRASKLHGKYADKVAVGGADDLPAIKTEADPEETARKVAFLLAQGLAAKAKPVDK